MACSKLSQAISFSQIVKGRDATVRVTDDNMLYMVDMVMVAHGSGRRYAAQVPFLWMHGATVNFLTGE